jgi:chaperonin cofactor prefoldin
MSWQMAAVAGIGAVTASQQNAYGKFNQAVNNRNALVKEQKVEAIDNKLELDLASFDKEFRKLEGNTLVKTLKSGVTKEGSAQRIEKYNLAQAELEKSKMAYDAEISKAQAFEQANFARISGQIAREESKTAMLRTATSVGTSLLTMQG